jgi:hypothetical protein
MNNIEAEIRNNLYEFYDEIARIGGFRSEKTDCCSDISNKPGIWPRLIYGIGAEIPDQSTTSVLQSTTSPELLIASDENIRQIDPFLRTKGFYPFSAWKGMAIINLSEIIPADLPETVQIVKPESSEEIDRWLEIVNSELVAPEIVEKSLFARLFDQPKFEAYLLKSNGVGVSTILVFTTETSTGLYLIATKKEAQKQGFAMTLVQQIVWQISKKTEKPVILHATQKGQGLYSKLGFLPFNQFFLYRNLNANL